MNLAGPHLLGVLPYFKHWPLSFHPCRISSVGFFNSHSPHFLPSMFTMQTAVFNGWVMVIVSPLYLCLHRHTMQHHSLSTVSPDILHHQLFSCFCSVDSSRLNELMDFLNSHLFRHSHIILPLLHVYPSLFACGSQSWY